MVHRLSIYLAKRALVLCIFERDEFDVYVYAFEKLFNQIITYLFLLTIGILMESFVYMIIYIIFFIVLRGQTGGYHAKTPMLCVTSSAIVSTVSTLMAKTILADKFIFILPGLFLSVLYIMKEAPINHVNLDLSLYEMKCLRKLSRRILVCEIILICLFYAFPITKALSVPAGLAIITVAVFMLLSKILKQEEDCYV